MRVSYYALDWQQSLGVKQREKDALVKIINHVWDRHNRTIWHGGYYLPITLDSVFFVLFFPPSLLKPYIAAQSWIAKPMMFARLRA